MINKEFVKKGIICSYIIILHIFLAIVLLKSNFIEKVEHRLGIAPRVEIGSYFYRILNYHSRMDGNVPDHSVIFIGDSITQGLCVSAVWCPSVNYGIGSDTTVGVLKRLSVYKSINRASAVVIEIGINDMKYRSNEKIFQNMKKIAQYLPQNIPIIFSAILPVDERVREDLKGWNKRIIQLNDKIKNWTKQTKTIFFIDIRDYLIDKTGNLSSKYHVGDGVHLNSLGNSIWIQHLKKKINNCLTRRST